MVMTLTAGAGVGEESDISLGDSVAARSAGAVESALSETGERLLRNFLQIVKDRRNVIQVTMETKMSEVRLWHETTPHWLKNGERTDQKVPH